MRRFGLAAFAAAILTASPVLAQDPCLPNPGESDQARTSPDSLVEDSLELRLNVPAYRLDVYDRGDRIRSYRVAVGTPEHPTPLGRYRLSEIVWNPWWVPPPFDWARDERITPPGPDNPTGRVKLFFGRYLFLHGTSADSSLGHAASHGCVRMSNSDAIDLARLVLERGSPDIGSAEIDSLVAAPRATRTYVLERQVRLTIDYRLVELRDGRLVLHPDVYLEGLPSVATVVSRLEQVGYDVRHLDLSYLHALVERGRQEHVSVRVTDLLDPPVGPN